MINYNIALDAALNKVAPDGASYERGAEIFWTTLRANPDNGLADDKAIQHALLETMADDANFEQYWEAYMTFWNIMESNKSGSLGDKIKGFASRGMAKISPDTPGASRRPSRFKTY